MGVLLDVRGSPTSSEHDWSHRHACRRQVFRMVKPGDGDAAQVMICFDTLLHLKRYTEKGLGAAGHTACLQIHHTLAAAFHRLRLAQVEMQASATILLYLLRADDAWIVSAVHVIDSTQWVKRDAAGQLPKRLVRHRPCGATHSTARAMHSTGFAAWYSIRLVSLTSTIPSHQTARQAHLRSCEA